MSTQRNLVDLDVSSRFSHEEGFRRGSLLGMHHVTAIASDPQCNLDFYTSCLGLRLVKVAVNVDDPSSYHLSYGGKQGRSGTLLTFLTRPEVPRGREGTGQINAVAFSVPRASLGYWMGRLHDQGIKYQGPTSRFGEPVLSLRDPDGLVLEIVAHLEEQEAGGWKDEVVPAKHAIAGISGVTLWEDDYEPTARFLTDTLGLRLVSREQNRWRYELGMSGSGSRMDVCHVQGCWPGAVAVGTVHHVAWRTATNDTQQRWQAFLRTQNCHVTPVLEQEDLRCTSFREPSGVLFEIATDSSDLSVNESVEQPGTRLQLPSWLEVQRSEIEQMLPPLRLPPVPEASEVRKAEMPALSSCADGAA